MINLVIGGGGSLAFIILGFIVGRAVERAHLRSLDEREARYQSVMRANIRALPANWKVSDAALVHGQAVIATDYFKSFAMRLRNIVGGEARSVETLMRRARREATLRMIEQAAALGANAVWNVRIETSEIGRGTAGKGAVMAEAFVYATALRVETGVDIAN